MCRIWAPIVFAGVDLSSKKFGTVDEFLALAHSLWRGLFAFLWRLFRSGFRLMAWQSSVFLVAVSGTAHHAKQDRSIVLPKLARQ